MEGCSAPLVVKFADTQKEKEQKKLQAMQASLWGITAPVAPTAYLASEAALSPATQLQLLQQLQAVGLQQQLLQGQGSTLLQGNIYCKRWFVLFEVDLSFFIFFYILRNNGCLFLWY